MAPKKRSRTSKPSTSRTTCTEDPEVTTSELGSTLPEGSSRASLVVQSTRSPRYNATQFRTQEVSKAFFEHYALKSVVVERKVTFSDFKESHPRIFSVFTQQEWTQMLCHIVKVSPTLVRKFFREHIWTSR